MRIGILGAGNMADALGTQWAVAGHEVMVSGRDLAGARSARLYMTAQAVARTSAPAAPATAAGTSAEARSRAVAEVLSGSVAKVRSGSFAEVAGFGDVVVVAVREAGLADTLRAARPGPARQAAHRRDERRRSGPV